MRLRDEGVSDVVGTAMLLAVTLSVVAVAAPAVLRSAEHETPPPPDLAFQMELAAGESVLGLRHVGGEARPMADLLVRVSLNGTEIHVAPLGGETPWRLGERVDVTLPRALAAGDHVEVTLVSKAARTALPAVAERVAQAPGPAASSAVADVVVQFRDNMDYAIANTSTTLYLQAKVRHPEGRMAVASVIADLSAIYGSTAAPLYDDATHGDLVAHDGVYSAHFSVPYNAQPGVHPITVIAEDIWGGRTQSRGELQIVEMLSGDANTPYYNETLFPRMGYNITKDPAKNELTIRLKMELADTKIMIDGVEYKLSKVFLEYPAFKPGATSGTWESGTNACTLPMALFTWSGAIQNYDVDVDPLPYYFRTEWKGSKGDFYHTNIEATPPAQYFTLRASEVTYSAGHAWSSFTDCSNT